MSGRLMMMCGLPDQRERARFGPLAALAIVIGLLLSACGGSNHARSTIQAAGQNPGSLAGPTLVNPAPAPPLVLQDYLGHPVDIANYRGRAVLVTFIYSHCPDVCPTIVANLHNALALLGARAARVLIVGVSVDPKGDNRSAVAAFLAKHAMIGRMEYLIGTRAMLQPVWQAWKVDAATPDANELVNHSAMVYGISASGMVMTVYPANFKPEDIAHDVPILAAS